MTSSYKLILLDFFNTIAVVDPSTAPTLSVGGRQVVSTAGILREFLQNHHPHLKTRQVFLAMEEAARRARARRGPELLEITALDRFRDVASALPLKSPPRRLAEKLLARHMRALVGSFALPPEHRGLLEELGRDFRLGIFSNFDHAPALRRFLGRLGIAGWFDPVVISDAIGFRKPGRRAFETAVAMAGEASGNILFVGDSLEEDVAGANDAGLDVAWINPGGRQPPGAARPTFVLDSLPGLKGIVRGDAA